MKIKQDLVTNSSSTSFIMGSKSDTDRIDVFIDQYNNVWRKTYIESMGQVDDFQEPPLLTSDMVAYIGGEFIITDFLSYYSNKQDAPQYIRELFDKDSIARKLLEQAGIMLVTVEMKDFNEKEGTI